jgi:hypothetical protein
MAAWWRPQNRPEESTGIELVSFGRQPIRDPIYGFTLRLREKREEPDADWRTK